MSLLQILHFLIGFCHLSLAVFIFTRSKRQGLNNLFSIFVFVLGVWSIISGLVSYPQIVSLQTALVLGRATWFLGTLALLCFFCIAGYLADHKYYFRYTFGLWFLLGLDFTDKFISNIKPVSWGYSITYHEFLFTLNIIILLSYTVETIFLLYKSQKTSPDKLTRNRLFFLGSTTALVLVAILNLIIPGFFGIQQTADYGPLLLYVFFFTSVVSFFWDRLLDIRLLVRKNLIQIIFSTFGIALYSLLVIALRRTLADTSSLGTHTKIIFTITTFSALASGALGLFAYKKNPQSAPHFFFGLFCVIISVWSVAMVVTLYASGFYILAVRLVMFLAMLQTLCFALFARSFLVTSWSTDTSAKLLTAVSLSSSLLAFTPLVFSAVENRGGIITSTTGALIGFYGLVLLMNILSGLYFFLKKYTTAKESKMRHQMLALFVSGLVMFALIYLFNFVFPAMLNNTSLIALAPIFTLPFIATAYISILRLRLLDIRLTIRKTRLSLFISVLLVGGYTYAILIIQSALARAGQPRDAQVVLLVIMIAIGILPLQRLSDKMLSRWFSGRRFLSDVIKKHNPEVPSLYLLAEEIAEMAEHLAQAERVMVCFFDPRTKQFVSVYPIDNRLNIYDDDPLLKALRQDEVLTVQDARASVPLKQLGYNGILALHQDQALLGLVLFSTPDSTTIPIDKLKNLNSSYAPKLYDALRYADTMIKHNL